MNQNINKSRTAILFVVSLILFAFIIVPSGYSEQNRFTPEAYLERMEAEVSNNAQVEQKIDSLLSLMTLEEKAGQMLHIFIAAKSPSDTVDFNENFNTERVVEFAQKYGFGFVLADLGLSSMDWSDFKPRIEKLYLENSRLKIPFIHAICHQHGPSFLTDGTIFPHNINLAATFDTTHAFNSGYVTALETAHLHHSFVYVPVVDLGRNPHWPRFYETFGESFLVCSEMGKSIVKGVQNNKDALPYKVSACAKHFIGYSDPKSGWDRNPVLIPKQQIYEYFVPSFQACIDAGVKIIEANSGEVNGVPVHASYEYLTELLRDQMGFKGVLNSDWADIQKLINDHGVAEDEKEATYLGLMAGLDCILTAEDYRFAQYTCELVRENRIPVERIDMSVKRILRLKYDLGLFDENFSIQPNYNDRIGRKNSKEKALNAARESLVLVKNNQNVLPLNPDKVEKIVVAGPNADSRSAIAGGWTVMWSDVRDEHIPDKVPSIFQSIQEQFKNSTIVLARDEKEIQEKAIGADAIIYVAGERPYAEYHGSINDMNLPEKQIDEIEAAINMEKPVILVLVAGRPRIVTRVYENVAGFIWAGLPGYQGGTAIAELIAGAYNPSGKLPFEYPIGPSTVMNYNRKKITESIMKEINKKTSLAHFGDGLSYTTFQYSNLQLSDTLITNQNQKLYATIEVTNTGKRKGKESVLWFINDEKGRITRPMKELHHFEKGELAPGETKQFKFTIDPIQHLSYPDEEGESMIENGFFTLMVGDLESRFKFLQK